MSATNQDLTVNSEVNKFKEFLGLFNKISEQCFMDCVNDFSSRKVSKKESTCSINCLTKHLKSTELISTRFQEEYTQKNQTVQMNPENK